MYESIVRLFHHPLQVAESMIQFHKIEFYVFFHRSCYDNAFPNVQFSYDEARSNVAIIFVSSHSSLTKSLINVYNESTFPLLSVNIKCVFDCYVPNIIKVGGIYVERTSSEKTKTSTASGK